MCYFLVHYLLPIHCLIYIHTYVIHCTLYLTSKSYNSILCEQGPFPESYKFKFQKLAFFAFLNLRSPNGCWNKQQNVAWYTYPACAVLHYIINQRHFGGLEYFSPSNHSALSKQVETIEIEEIFSNLHKRFTINIIIPSPL